MACSLKCGSYVSGFNETVSSSNSKASTSKKFPPLSSDVLRKQLVVPDQKKGSRNCSSKTGNRFSVQAEAACLSRSMRWWEKNRKPNMVKIHSAEQLVCSLQNAGGRLVIIDFYSPGCGGCKALHPKICQLAEQNPNAIFLEINCSTEALKADCAASAAPMLPSRNSKMHWQSTDRIDAASAPRKEETTEELVIMRSMELSGMLNNAGINRPKLEKDGVLP
ncbi:hypothetical protein V6N13_035923 [Hibiscus sabdariffa]|uniref:Thioredoxin domain-containing protein n=1 Tax=Hibiscus sabdariffa TaxID=183260 RepID=A0ABR2S8R9_9ROSI